MPQFVDQQNAEQRHGKRPAGDEVTPAGACQPLEKAHAPDHHADQAGRLGRPPSARERRPGAQRADDGQPEQDDVQQPALGPAGTDRTDEHQVGVLRIGPVVAAGPVGERLRQGWRRTPMLRGNQRLDVFSTPQCMAPPRLERGSQCVHATS